MSLMRLIQRLLKRYFHNKMYVLVLLLVIMPSSIIMTSLLPAYQIPRAVVATPFNNNVAVSSDTNKITVLTSNNNFSSDTLVFNSSTVSTSKTIVQQEIVPAIYLLAKMEKMMVTKQQVIDILNVDEPNYANAAKLGPDALPHLDTLVKTADPMLASKAAYVASLIQSEQSIDVLKAAAQSEHPEVRVAAAAGAHNLNVTVAKAFLVKLLTDEDIGVREEALNSLNKLCDMS